MNSFFITITLEEALEELKEEIQPDKELYSLGEYLFVDKTGNRIVLDGEYFSPHRLMCIAIYALALQQGKI